MMVEAAAAAGSTFLACFVPQDSSDDEAKKEIPMSPFLTTPNPVKQTKAAQVDSSNAHGVSQASSALAGSLPGGHDRGGRNPDIE